MHILTNNSALTPSVSQGAGSSAHTARLHNTGYAARRDEQHALVWDQEAPRMTFADVPSAEELALNSLFEVARRHGRIAENINHLGSDFTVQNLQTQDPRSKDMQLKDLNAASRLSQSLSSQNLNVLYEACLEAVFPAGPADVGKAKDRFTQEVRLDFSPVPVDRQADTRPASNFRRRPLSASEATELAESLIDLVSTETLRHVSSYEKLLRNTSYRVLEGHAGDLKDIPVGESKLIDASLQKIVDSADQVSADQYSQYLSTPAFRCQAFLSLGARSSDAACESKKLRGAYEQPKTRVFFSFACNEAREALSNLWNRVVSKKNASLSLAVMRRKMRVR